MKQPQRKKCKGHVSGGRPCKAWAMHGQDVCRVHGGSSPQARAKAAERLAEAKLRRVFAATGHQPVDDPLTELSKLAGEVVAWKNFLADRVAELERLRYTGVGTEQIRGEVQLFERALDRCAAVLGMIARLNIDERLARVTERQADALLHALEAALAHAGVTGERAVEAKQVAARQLRVVA